MSSLFIITGSVVVGLPRYLLAIWLKYDCMALLAGMSMSLLRMWPKRRQRLSMMCIVRGLSLHILYNDLFVIFVGWRMFNTLDEVVFYGRMYRV